VSSGVIRIVLTGSESTGKTELARALAAHYRTAWSAEYVRDYMDAKGGALDAHDVEPIARGQIAREDALEEGLSVVGYQLSTTDNRQPVPPSFVILDTDLLSTVIYACHYYGSCPAWIERAAHERLGDLYLLLDVDAPWTPDPQRDRGERREEMHALFRDALEAAGARVVVIGGGWEERRLRAIEAIDAFLA
jgi:NadR type nicotinamide-nucleotide adenylyltransferase